MKTLLFIVVLCFASAVFCAPKCGKSRKNAADRCAKEALFLSSPETIPKDLKAAEDYCTNVVEESVKCVQKYGTDCLKGFAAQVMRIGANGMKKAKNRVCKRESDREAFVKNVKWLTAEKSEQLNDCVTKHISNMEFISKKIESNDQIPQSCCSYWLFRDCYSRRLKELAPKNANVNYMENLLESGTSNLIEFLCNKQNSIDTCNKLMPDAMRRMKSIYQNRDKQQTELKSLVLPFLEVILD